ncbi:hypothetical protein Q3G72_018297 [Acer saccharum]|nr:hypothetical protein Q3G72_018297 [Acer saccharum]
MDGKNEQSSEVKSPERDKGTNDAMNEPFGPWMQVSYGRQGRGNLGPNQNGNKNGNSGKNGNGFRYTNGTPTPGAGNYGKVGSGTKNVNEPSTYGAENSRQTMGNIKDSKRVVEIKAKKGDYLKLDGRRSYKNAGGSRFAIFNEVAEEVTAVEEVPESSNQEIRPPPPGKLPNPSTVEFIESSTTLVEKVDVSGETNFDIVASKLKEVMDTILE